MHDPFVKYVKTVDPCGALVMAIVWDNPY